MFFLFEKERKKTLVAEAGFEPHDLRVMSPTSYQLLHSAPIYNACLFYCMENFLSTVFLLVLQNKFIFLFSAVFRPKILFFAFRNVFFNNIRGGLRAVFNLNLFHIIYKGVAVAP